MLTRISFLAWALLSATGIDARVINKENGNIAANSDMGRHIMSKARMLENNNNNQYQYQNGNEEYDENYQMDPSFLVGYSVKFQGCHHVQQWNPDAAEEDDVRIMTKRLIRFRLCPAGDCASDLYGCTSHYGDYVVDMETFVSAYMENQQNMYGEGYNGQYGGNRKLDFDVSDYTECQQFDMRRHLQNNNNYYQNADDEQAYYLDEDGNVVYYDEDLDYYIGPYCADQGGEIHLGLFYDDTCTSFAKNGEQMFYQTAGYSLPYSDRSMVSLSCMSCTGYNQDNENGGYEVSEFCEDIYTTSGKCETKMNVGYPNESSCSYIEGIKIIREDGVIRTGSTKKSKAAAICIGIFLTIAVLLAGYVYYLRTKLGRAKINLAAASQTLT